MGWILWLDKPPRPGWANMSIDLALLDRAEQQGEHWLRLYRWNPHCLSFGRHEPATRRYNRARIECLKLEVVRRPTGGRAVWHSRELTYAVAAPSRDFGSLQAAYVEIHTMLRDGLEQLGIVAELAPRSRAGSLDSGACFGLAAGGEVLVQGRKVVGSAQLRRGNAFLQHGSILLEDDQDTVLALTRGQLSDRCSSPGSGLARWNLAAESVDPTELCHALGRAAGARWGGPWALVHAPGRILDQAATYFPHFQSPAWTWAR
jgi:lipoyl(octanoyl) transferase